MLYQLSYCGAAIAGGRRPMIGDAVYANFVGFGNMVSGLRQAARLSKQGREPGEAGFVPAGPFELAPA